MSEYRLEFAPGFQHALLRWGAPEEPASDTCSYCDATLPRFPIRMWNEQGWAIALCGKCAGRWLRFVRD